MQKDTAFFMKKGQKKTLYYYKLILIKYYKSLLYNGLSGQSLLLSDFLK